MKQIGNKQPLRQEVQYPSHTHTQRRQYFSKQMMTKVSLALKMRQKACQKAMDHGLPIALMKAGGSLDASNQSKSGMK